ncbi:TonB-dependent receptor [Wielerella bovis]|uniref:TonB-dependent receptor n=1 Tax=Wielerella bovis TaxID=2917790 RepID=UPI002019D522|nr:TonB-dependent receptor [Wielerella bovis]ULJ70296.1 TonB-dependent receptor [Wielerella bovis]
MSHPKILFLSVCLIGFHAAYAESVTNQNNNPIREQTLPEVIVRGKSNTALPFKRGHKASDVVVNGAAFKTRSATLGNALAEELGIHSNPFGGGASAPIIRGQEGARIKILQNGSDVVDMSAMSPDHAVAADTLLAQQVEVVRGTPTLLYSTASPAGVVNVVDKRIPTQMPKNKIEGEWAARLDSASKEKAINLGLTLGLGNHVAVRAEGLVRQSDNYRVPEVKLGETLKYLPDTHNKSRVGTLGISWVGDKGHLGVSYSRRRDHYGIPGHNHQLDNGSFHVFNTAKDLWQPERKYLYAYPHLMTDMDISNDFHDAHTGTAHAQNGKHSHDNPYGHQHDHSSQGPVIDMISKRYDVRGEWRQPFKGVDKLKMSLAWADYYHDEKDDGKAHFDHNTPQSRIEHIKWERERNKGRPNSFFGNKGFNSRLEVHHQPFKGLNGLLGVQYQTQKSYATRPAPNPNDCEVVRNENGNIEYTDDKKQKPRQRCNSFGEKEVSQRRPLVHNTNKQFGVFALEQFKWRNWTFEGAARWEKQSIPIQYDMAALESYTPPKAPDTAIPDLSTYRQKALSYSGTVLWDFHPDYRLSFTASHNERLPTPVELYYHGKHLATNSFEYGNRDLRKESSNNYELGLRYAGERWDAKISAYQNRFKNYIHNETIYREGNLYMRRYLQSQARFHGLEGELGFQINPNHKITVFGDVVRGKLFRLPDIYGPPITEEYECVDEWGDEDICTRMLGYEMVKRPDRNAARVPPARLGFRLNNQWNENWSSNLSYTHVFKQKRTSDSFYVKKKSEDDPTNVSGNSLDIIPIQEDATKGYHLLNAGVSYHKHAGKLDYTLTLQANNLLNQKIYSHTSYLPYVPQMGRNVQIGVNVNF